MERMGREWRLWLEHSKWMALVREDEGKEKREGKHEERR